MNDDKIMEATTEENTTEVTATEETTQEIETIEIPVVHVSELVEDTVFVKSDEKILNAATAAGVAALALTGFAMGRTVMRFVKKRKGKDTCESNDEAETTAAGKKTFSQKIKDSKKAMKDIWSRKTDNDSEETVTDYKSVSEIESTDDGNDA